MNPITEHVLHQAAQLSIFCKENLTLYPLKRPVEGNITMRMERQMSKSPVPGRIGTRDFCFQGVCSTSVLQPLSLNQKLSGVSKHWKEKMRDTFHVLTGLFKNVD